VNFEFVQEMSANPSGKYRYIICEVPDRWRRRGLHFK